MVSAYLGYGSRGLMSVTTHFGVSYRKVFMVFLLVLVSSFSNVLMIDLVFVTGKRSHIYNY